MLIKANVNNTYCRKYIKILISHHELAKLLVPQLYKAKHLIPFVVPITSL